MATTLRRHSVSWIFLMALFSGRAESAESGRLWLPLNTADSELEIDYSSIQLQGATPTVSIKQKFAIPVTNGGNSYSAVVHHYAIDCKGRILTRLSSNTFDENSPSGEGVDIQPPAANERVPLGQLKSICLWRDHGLSVPDVGLQEKWDEMDSPVSTLKVYEATRKRQKRDGIVLIKQRTESTPEISMGGIMSRYATTVSAYDCEKHESHLTIAVRFDLTGKPITGMFYGESPNTPKLEVNRDRFAAACQ